MKLTVISGPMFGGKSTRLVERVQRAMVTDTHVRVVKPQFDTRTGDVIATHFGSSVKATPVDDVALAEMRFHPTGAEPGVEMLFIDEAQFFTPHALMACLNNAERDRVDAVAVAGLNRDFLGRPFPSVAALLPFADEILLQPAVCTGEHPVWGMCGGDAFHTQRVVDGEAVTSAETTIEVGGSEAYAPRCSLCFQRASAVGSSV